MEKMKMLMREWSGLENGMQKIDKILEDETNRKIRLIAEGRLDLNTSFDERSQKEREKEALLKRIERFEREKIELRRKIEIVV